MHGLVSTTSRPDLHKTPIAEKKEISENNNNNNNNKQSIKTVGDNSQQGQQQSHTGTIVRHIRLNTALLSSVHMSVSVVAARTEVLIGSLPSGCLPT